MVNANFGLLSEKPKQASTCVWYAGYVNELILGDVMQ